MRRTRPKSTDPHKREQQRSVARGVALHIALQLLSAAALLWLRTLTVRRWLDGLLLVVAVLDLVTIPPSVVVLRQRMREIERGELDEARKY